MLEIGTSTLYTMKDVMVMVVAIPFSTLTHCCGMVRTTHNGVVEYGGHFCHLGATSWANCYWHDMARPCLRTGLDYNEEVHGQGFQGMEQYDWL